MYSRLQKAKNSCGITLTLATIVIIYAKKKTECDKLEQRRTCEIVTLILFGFFS
jgi:hypothetical protein